MYAYVPGFAKLCSPFLRVLAVTTLFGLQANVAQGGRVRKEEGVGWPLLEPEQSTEIGVRAGSADFQVGRVG